MYVKLPYKIWIKSKRAYYIVWVDRFDGDTDRVTTRGECCSKTKQIYLRRGMDPEETTETFIHEVFHAIEFEWKLPIPHKLIYRLEKIVTQIFKWNGWVITEGEFE